MLVRVVEVDGQPVIGLAGQGGRGAWLCANAACITEAGEKRAYSRAFRRRIADPLFADTLLGWLIKQRDSRNP